VPITTGILMFDRSFEKNKTCVGASMTIKETLNFAGLALGITATIAWTALIAFALSQAIAWLL
jgi:hypothetical protein